VLGAGGGGQQSRVVPVQAALALFAITQDNRMLTWMLKLSFFVACGQITRAIQLAIISSE